MILIKLNCYEDINHSRFSFRYFTSEVSKSGQISASQQKYCIHQHILKPRPHKNIGQSTAEASTKVDSFLSKANWQRHAILSMSKGHRAGLKILIIKREGKRLTH